jgi:hypothetical protein
MTGPDSGEELLRRSLVEVLVPLPRVLDEELYRGSAGVRQSRGTLHSGQRMVLRAQVADLPACRWFRGRKTKLRITKRPLVRTTYFANSVSLGRPGRESLRDSSLVLVRPTMSPLMVDHSIRADPPTASPPNSPSAFASRATEAGKATQLNAQRN